MEKTIKNLAAAFIGESQARNRYSIYAKVAKNEGYEQISEIFTLTADQEREHAKWLMRMIKELKEENDDILLEASCPNVVGNTEENLQAAIDGENHEHESMYPEFAATAREEGLDKVADRLEAIAKAEAHHEERYQKLIKELKNSSIFKKVETKSWVCRKCGFEHSGEEAPMTCPACAHPQAYFQIKCETY